MVITGLRKKVLAVFKALAKAEAIVHGKNIDDVHFHEIGSVDALVDVIGVCAAFNYLSPNKVYCNEPMLGEGFVDTEHGKLSIPAP